MNIKLVVIGAIGYQKFLSSHITIKIKQYWSKVYSAGGKGFYYSVTNKH